MSDDQQISFEEISNTIMIQVEALLRLLVKKGVITKDELSQEVD
jgi:hypothetical protein